MKELVVISGKGGTGKTSLAGALATLAGSVVLADCDVDASDLPIILQPQIRQCHDFVQGHYALINNATCVGCGACQGVCRFDAIAASTAKNSIYHPFAVDPLVCEGCGACLQICPLDAISLQPRHAGQWFISDTPIGPLVHARLNPGGQNSGKLVSLVRQHANKIAKERCLDLVLIDGSPGIGCPVIASVARADGVLIVTEPTPSGLHDMMRVIELTRHFRLPTMLCVNRWDINSQQTEAIEVSARNSGVKLAGRVRVDGVFNAAQRQRRTVAQIAVGPVMEDIRQLWSNVSTRLFGAATAPAYDTPPRSAS